MYMHGYAIELFAELGIGSGEIGGFLIWDGVAPRVC